MKIIGVTGGFGTGKTLVVSQFKALGAKVIDADEIAHSILKKGSNVYKRIIGLCGAGILDKGGAIDRRKLAKAVFGDGRLLKDLERITHPEIIRRIKAKIRRMDKNDTAVIDAPLIVEANATGLVDRLVVVRSSRKRQVARCKSKFRMSRAEVLKRIDSQLPIKEKIKLADFVIDNDGTKSETRKRVIKLWRRINGNS